MWEVCRDNVELKVGSKGKKYLPRPATHTNDKKGNAKFANYHKRAVYYPYTKHTHDNLASLIHSRQPQVDLPQQIEDFTDNINGAGLTMEGLSALLTSEALTTGRAGLLVDFQGLDGGGELTRAEFSAMGLAPRLMPQMAEQIINWKANQKDPSKLDLLVLAEKIFEDTENPFTTNAVEQWRVYERTEDGVFVTVWRRSETDKQEFEIYTETRTVNSARGAMGEIPFIWIGSENNDAEPDMPPLLGIAELNIAHYRNSADYEQSVFITASPTPVFTGLEKQWADSLGKQNIALGSENPVALPKGATFGLLQATSGGMQKEAMEGKEESMVALGAKTVQPSAQVKTATQTNIENRNSTSTLSKIARNVSEAMEKALAIALSFVETAELEVVYQLEDDFTALNIDPQMLAQVAALELGGQITDEEAREYYKRAGVATLEIEDARDMLED
jgi:rRNA maturation endonuclease Nob1